MLELLSKPTYFYPILGSLGDELTSFGNISALDDELPSSKATGKKRKASKVGKKHGKKRRFR